ncbi:hypothetical protein [Thioalkalivibrio sp. ALE12]|uniref:hypothetical protein n=1 Tax=Thioalkalivibrio sp. ALE12 TaxID=1158170 RepID=UPI0012DDD047|nr:hypothetical protein [Thioalkalivibrio sp. ALE12]
MALTNEIGLAFETLKETRGPGLFVEYLPADEYRPFASLSLVYAECHEGMEAITKRIRDEAQHWFGRFPAPIVATAFNSDDDPIDVSDGNNRHDLLVYSHAGEVVTEWGRLGDFAMPPFDTSPDNLLRVYSSISYSTKEERRKEGEKKLKEQRVGMRVIIAILFFRRTVIPAAVALAFYVHPILGLIGLIGTLADAAIGGLRVLGYLPKSKKEKREEEKRRRMEHHDYHCQLNPKGFAALKAENLGERLRERVKQEARDLHSENS